MTPLCEFCNKPMTDITSPKQRFHNKNEDPECHRLRQRKYDNDYYKRNKDILKHRKGLGTSRLSKNPHSNISEEIIKIRREMKRLGLIKHYTKPITYINLGKAVS